MPITRAGIDIALWDLLGKLTGKPLAGLWGKKPGGELTLSWTVNARNFDEVDGIMAAGRDRGYRHFNIKVVAPSFEGLSTLERHRKVLNALKELMAGHDAPVHAIDSIRATPS